MLQQFGKKCDTTTVLIAIPLSFQKSHNKNIVLLEVKSRRARVTLGVRLKGTHMSFFSHLETFLPSHGNTRESGVAWQVSLERNGKQREKKLKTEKKHGKN